MEYFSKFTNIQIVGQLYDEDLEISKYALTKKHVYFVYNDSTYYTINALN